MDKEYIANEDYQRESKEFFFGSPLWRTHNSTIGSLDSMRRRLYSRSTSYGEGKLILTSLDPTQDLANIFSLKYSGHQNVKDNVQCYVDEYKGTLILKDSPSSPKTLDILTLNPILNLSADDYTILLSVSLRSFMDIHGFTTRDIAEETGIAEFILEDLIECPQDKDNQLSFNDGFDLETYILSY